MKDKKEKHLIAEIVKQFFITVPEFLAEKVLLVVQGFHDLRVRAGLYGILMGILYLLLVLVRWIGGQITA